MNHSLILPVGTQIVSRVELKNTVGETLCLQGAVGVIVKSPTDGSHAYRIRLPEEVEITLHRQEFSIRKHFQKEGLTSAEKIITELNLYDYIIYRCIVGSRAYGLDNHNSDIDRRGIYLPSANSHWSLYGIPEQLEKVSS